MASEIYYSDRYKDDEYEYRHVLLPEKMMDKIVKGKLMTEDEWRKLGVQQSAGWVHYAIFEPEPNILLFRRKLSSSSSKK